MQKLEIRDIDVKKGEHVDFYARVTAVNIVPTEPVEGDDEDLRKVNQAYALVWKIWY